MQKVFWTQGAKVSEKSFAPPKPHFAPVQKQFWVVQKTFRRPLLPGSKRPFAPSPKHFWELSLFGQFPRPVASQFLHKVFLIPGCPDPNHGASLTSGSHMSQESEAWDHPPFRKTAPGVKGHSRSSRRVPGCSRSNSRNSESDSRNAKFHSRNGISRLEQ